MIRERKRKRKRKKGITYHTSLPIQTPTQRINRNDMRALLIPRTVFAPVCCRDLFPGVVEVVG